MTQPTYRARDPGMTYERPSGVPPPGGLGESKRLVMGLLGAGALLLLIVLAFWLEARP